MKIEELLAKMNEHFSANVRCSECWEIFLSKKGERWWRTPYPHECVDLGGEVVFWEAGVGVRCGYT